MAAMTYEARILKALNTLGTNGTANPDAQSNTVVGSILGQAFLWDKVHHLAKARRDEAFDAVKEIFDTAKLTPGTHQGPVSAHFGVTAAVSNPVKKFDPGTLAAALNKRYRVPIPVALEMIEAAKIETKSTVTLKLAERVPE